MRRAAPVAAIAFAMSVLLIPTGRSAGVGGTTGAQTIVSVGERALTYGPGEARVTRSLRWKSTTGTGRGLGGFKQVSDVHVVDSESPGRVEFFDRCSFGSSAYRPQEAMSTQVGESMIRRLNEITEGPATGVDLGFSISTGDNIDNNQRNELDWFIDLMNGDMVTPNSGGPAYDGYTQAITADALPVATLDLAIQPFQASGIGPWYAVLGNHDGLVQGNLSASTTFRYLVTQGTKVFIDPAAYFNEGRCPAAITDAEDAFFDVYFGEDAETVPADFSRIFMGHRDIVATYAEDEGGKPAGHGLANAPNDPVRSDSENQESAGYYAFNVSDKIRGISMDTISYAATSDGILNDSQFKWIEKQMKANSKIYYSKSGKRQVNPGAKNKLFMIFSHHSSRTINHPGDFPDVTEKQKDAMLPQHCFTKGAATGCDKGEGFRDLLQRYPNVIAWVNGHEHNNRVTGFPAPKGQDPARSFWEINTASHIDWPQQSRILEVAHKSGADGSPGSIFIYGTLVDHAADPAPDQVAQDPVAYLASLSRVESYYDACVRVGQADCAAGGEARDRNVKLVLKAPFDL